jgi:hypothetical protein
MRVLSVKLGVILIGLAVFSYAEVWGAQWTEYAHSEVNGVKAMIHLYDSESVMVDKAPGDPLQRIIKVWEKSVITEAYIEQIQKENPSSTITYDYVPRLLEINCKNKMYRILQGRVYDYDGEQKKLLELPTKWMYFNPDSIYLFLCERLCLGK